MAEDRSSRREILKKATVAGMVGAVAGADIAWSAGVFKPKYEVTPEVLPRLDTLAEKIEGKLTTSGFESPLETKKGKVQASLNKNVFSQAMVLLAYLNGGMSEAEKVSEFLNKRGIEFSLGGWQGSVIPSPDENTSVVLNLGRDNAIYYYEKKNNLSVDSLIWHEMYHVVQQARDPEHYDMFKMASALAGPAAVVSATIPEAIQSNRKGTFSRRKFAGNLGKGIVAGLSAALFFQPKELQAYIQGGGPTDRYGTLTKEEHFGKFQGKMFNFEQVG